tara:strand:- start:199 stop:489 length:291 start_codon:yes stop_codon:yes gene_type:complete
MSHHNLTNQVATALLDIENALISYVEDNISSDEKAKKELDKSWSILKKQIFNVSKYNQKAMDILFAYIPEKDLQKVINKLVDEKIKGVNINVQRNN